MLTIVLAILTVAVIICAVPFVLGGLIWLVVAILWPGHTDAA
jgi:hypothetical protein